VVGGNSCSQRTGEDPEPERRLEDCCLAVDPGRDGSIGVDFKCWGRPLADPEVCRPCALGWSACRPDHRDAELSAV